MTFIYIIYMNFISLRLRFCHTMSIFTDKYNIGIFIFCSAYITVYIFKIFNTNLLVPGCLDKIYFCKC